MRPHDAPGAGGSGDAAERAQPSGRAVAAGRDLGQDGLARSLGRCPREMSMWVTALISAGETSFSEPEPVGLTPG